MESDSQYKRFTYNNLFPAMQLSIFIQLFYQNLVDTFCLCIKENHAWPFVKLCHESVTNKTSTCISFKSAL